MAVWDKFLTENDNKVLGARKGGPRLMDRPHAQFGERAAILVIDMNIGAVGEDRPVYELVNEMPSAMGDKAWGAIRYMEELLPKARAAGIPVIYSNHIFRAIHGLPGATDPNFSHGELSPQAELQAEIAPQEGDLLIEKQRASVFFQSGLIYMLMNKKIDNLIVTGNSTSGCVRASVIDGARGFNFKVSVIEECVFDRIEFAHAVSLFDMNFKYADVVSINDVYGYIDTVKDGQRAPESKG